MTLTELARLANVSISTASKAFSGNGDVSEETREHVFEVARGLGCFKQFYNAKYPRTLVALLFPETRSRYYMESCDRLQSALEAVNCDSAVASFEFSAEKLGRLLQYYDLYASADAAVIVDNPEDFRMPKTAIPVVKVMGESDPSDPAIPSIVLSWSPAFRELLSSYVSRGVRPDEIAFIGERETRDKLSGFRQILRELNAPPRCVVTEKRFAEGGYEAMERLYAEGPLPRAVICAYDYMAFGAIRCVADHGGRVPDDVAVVGMNDLPEAAYSIPRLATIRTNHERVSEVVSATVRRLLDGESVPSVQTVTGELVMRESGTIEASPRDGLA